MSITHVPLPLAFAWVCYRDEQFVNSQVDWQCEGKGVVEVEARYLYSPPTGGRRNALRSDTACRALRHAILQGKVKTREPISARDWPNELDFEGVVAWVDFKSLKSAFPFETPRDTGPVRIRDQTECTRWLTEEMKASPQKRPRPKPSYLKEARERCTSLSKRAFERSWAEAMVATGATAWGIAGRPPKKSPQA